MLQKLALVGAIGLGVVSSAPAHAAGYVFDLHFDAYDQYAATDIKYTADSVTATMLNYLSGSVNGLTFSTIQFNGYSYAPFGGQFGPTGQVVSFYLHPETPVTSTGYYATNTAARGVSFGPGATGYYVSTGSLTVSAAPSTAAPEPATWAMLVVGFGAVGATLRGARRRALRFA